MIRLPNCKLRACSLIVACAAFIVFSLFFAAKLQGDNHLDLTLIDTDGNSVRLGDLAKGKPLLLYFWATWCKPCRTTTPKVAALAEKHKNKVQVLGINVGGLDSLQSIKKYRKRYNIPFVLLMDSNNVMVKAYSVFVIPTVILLNETGKILFRDNEAPTDLDEFLSG